MASSKNSNLASGGWMGEKPDFSFLRPGYIIQDNLLDKIEKHHKTGSHGEHMGFAGISPEWEGQEEAFDEADLDISYAELKTIGSGSKTYITSIVLVGMAGVMVYRYITKVDDVSPEQFEDAAYRFHLTQRQLNKIGRNRPDIDLIILLIVADMLNTDINDLSDANLRQISWKAVQEVLDELEEEGFDMEEAIDTALSF